MTKLTSMLKDKVEAWVEVDGFPGFEVKLAYMSRTEVEKIRKAATRNTFNKRTHLKEEEVDGELFVETLVKTSVLDWKGFTLKYASIMLPLELPKDSDLDAIVEFSKDDVLSLVKNSPIFDQWLNDTVFDLDSFRSK